MTYNGCDRQFIVERKTNVHLVKNDLEQFGKRLGGTPYTYCTCIKQYKGLI